MSRRWSLHNKKAPSGNCPRVAPVCAAFDVAHLLLNHYLLIILDINWAMANPDFLPTLTPFDVEHAAQVSQVASTIFETVSLPASVNTAGLRASNPSNDTRSFETTPTRPFRDPETPRGLGAGHPIVEPRGPKCSILWRPYSPSEDREGLVNYISMDFLGIL